VAGITWNKRTGHLVTGHQRIEQLRGKDAIIEGNEIVASNGERFLIRVVDWPERKEKAANVAANNQKISGEFTLDLDTLLPEIKLELGEEDFAELQIDALAQSLKLDSKEVIQDEVPEPPSNPITKLGDMWELGEHRVLCGDCSCVAAKCYLEPYELLTTDPPYGVSYASKNKFLNSCDEGNRIQDEIKNDHQKPEEMFALWKQCFGAVRAYAKPGASYYVTGPQGGDLLLFLLLALKDSGFPLRHMLIWAKNNHVLGRSDYNYKHEPIIFGWTKGAPHYFYRKAQTSLWEIDKPHQSKLHPTMKPVALFAKAMENSSKNNDVVADPFLGSGTTLIAAEQLNRKCYGIEIEPKYVDVCIERWENLTGGKAKKKKA